MSKNISKLSGASYNAQEDLMNELKAKLPGIFTEAQIVQIPTTSEFSELRYYKTDVADFVNKLK
jgi:hypothetical protein